MRDRRCIGAGFAEAGFTAYDHLRLRLGVPDGSRDLVLEKSILLEAGFDELNGVDWDKGCYIGQELTARTKYRGLVKRRLVPVAIDGPAPAPGTIVTADGRDVGEMRSSNDEAGLALLRIEAVLGNKRLTSRGRRDRAENSQLDALRRRWLVLEEGGGAFVPRSLRIRRIQLLLDLAAVLATGADALPLKQPLLAG